MPGKGGEWLRELEKSDGRSWDWRTQGSKQSRGRKLSGRAGETKGGVQPEQPWSRGGDGCSLSVSAAPTLKEMDEVKEIQRAWPRAAHHSAAAPAAEGSGRESGHR